MMENSHKGAERGWRMFEAQGRSPDVVGRNIWVGDEFDGDGIPITIDKKVCKQEPFESIYERVSYLTEYTLEQLQTRYDCIIGKADIPSIAVVDDLEVRGGGMRPVKGDIEVEYTSPSTGLNFSRSLIHELIHYYSTRWIYIESEEGSEFAESRLTGIRMDYTLGKGEESELITGFGVFDEASTSMLETEIAQTLFPGETVEPDCYQLGIELLEELFDAVRMASFAREVTLFRDDGSMYPAGILQKDDVKKIFYRFQLASRSQDLAPEERLAAVCRRRNWGRVMVHTFGEGIRNVARLSQLPESGEADEEYEQQLKELQEYLGNRTMQLIQELDEETAVVTR